MKYLRLLTNLNKSCRNISVETKFCKHSIVTPYYPIPVDWQDTSCDVTFKDMLTSLLSILVKKFVFCYFIIVEIIQSYSDPFSVSCFLLSFLILRIWHSRKWYCWTCFAPGLLGVFNILGGCSNSSSISFIATKWECGQFNRPLHLLSWVRIFHLSLAVVFYWRITFLPTSSVFKEYDQSFFFYSAVCIWSNFIL